ncbi:sel1 repeat family protein [Weeksellaceae bacterium TAE3-ERU29]|nr:sel1 repeat family protein [Weeksellaceae bacterium TAE3-ERU29]
MRKDTYQPKEYTITEIQNLLSKHEKNIDTFDTQIINERLTLLVNALKNDYFNDSVKNVYDSLYKKRRLVSSCIWLSEEEYQKWFKDAYQLNLDFIEKGHTIAYSNQFDLIDMRRTTIDKTMQDALAFIEKGIEKKDPDCLCLMAYFLTFGYFDRPIDKEKAQAYLQEVKDMDFKDVDFFEFIIQLRGEQDQEKGEELIQEYRKQPREENPANFVIAEFYLRTQQPEKALPYLEEGKKENEFYCYHIWGIEVINGNIPVENPEQEGLEALRTAFEHGTMYSGYLYGTRLLYGEKPEKKEEGLTYIKQAALFNEPTAQYELGTFYLFNEDEKDVAQGLRYLEQAVQNGNSRAEVEMGILLLDPESPVGENREEAFRLFQKAYKSGNPHAAFRLGYGYQNGIWEEDINLDKALEYYDIAAEGMDLYGLENAGKFHLYGWTGEPQIDKAIDYYTKAMEHYNSAFAMVELAMCHENGTGVECDLLRAEELYLKALEQDYIYAALRLGYLYRNPEFENHNDEKAFTYIQRAAEHEFAEALNALALCYHRGTGTEQDLDQAFTYYQKAAEAGYVPAYVDLAFFYESGEGSVSEDENKAFEYMEKAADEGYHYAQFCLGGYYANGIGTEPDEEKALACFQQAYENGSPWGAYRLGEYYLYDLGGENEEEKAFPYYLYAYENGLTTEDLGICYEFGIGTETDVKKAFEIYKEYADQGLSTSMYRVALCYYKGEGTTTDKVEAYDYFQKAADLGDVISMSYAGKMLVDGEGIEQNPEQGIALLKNAAENNESMALYELGNCYLTGLGVEEDSDTAMVYYQRAAEQGHEKAGKIIGRTGSRRRKF